MLGVTVLIPGDSGAQWPNRGIADRNVGSPVEAVPAPMELLQLPVDPSVAIDDEVAIAVEKWLRCLECREGQLERVLGFGQRAVALLAASLRNGASSAARETLRAELMEGYMRLQVYQVDHPHAALVRGMRAYVDGYLRSFDDLLRVRAATALASLDSSEGRRQLRSVETKALSVTAATAIEELLEED